jgi:hypothetical protein
MPPQIPSSFSGSFLSLSSFRFLSFFLSSFLSLSLETLSLSFFLSLSHSLSFFLSLSLSLSHSLSLSLSSSFRYCSCFCFSWDEVLSPRGVPEETGLPIHWQFSTMRCMYFCGTSRMPFLSKCQYEAVLTIHQLIKTNNSNLSREVN